MGFFKSFFKALTNIGTILTAVAIVAIAGYSWFQLLISIAIYAAANAALALSPKPHHMLLRCICWRGNK